MTSRSLFSVIAESVTTPETARGMGTQLFQFVSPIVIDSSANQQGIFNGEHSTTPRE
jgi:hypothetical protein